MLHDSPPDTSGRILPVYTERVSFQASNRGAAMSDAAIKNARAHQDALASRINTLQQELDGLRTELRDVRTFIAQWHRFAGEEDETANVQGEHTQNTTSIQPVDNEDGAKRTKRSNPKKEVVAEVARRIITERGEPMPRAALFAALKENGIELEGAEPEMVLSTMLWRTQKQGGPIIRLRGGGYWPADRPNAEAGYHPTGSRTLGGERYEPLPDETADLADEDGDSEDDQGPSPDDERDAQFDRETDEAAARLEAERAPPAPMPLSPVARDDETPPPAPPRPRPARESQAAADNPFAAFMNFSGPTRRT